MTKEKFIMFLFKNGFECRIDEENGFIICTHKSGKVEFIMNEFIVQDSEAYLRLYFESSHFSNINYKFDLDKLETIELYFAWSNSTLFIKINDDDFRISLE